MSGKSEWNVSLVKIKSLSFIYNFKTTINIYMSDELDDFTAELNSGSEQPVAQQQPGPGQRGPGGPPGQRGPGGPPPNLTPQ